MLDLLVSTLIQGLIYALVFPDLSVDGSFPLGAAVTAVLLSNGCNPYLTLLAALCVGALAGLFTGFIHVKLHVRDLLAGIITMTALFSINLQIAGSNLTVERAVDTIFTAGPTMALFGGLSLTYRKLIVALIITLLVKLLLDAFFATKAGLLLRAVGDNAFLVTSLAKDKGNVKLAGLVISNALVALGGALVCHETRSFSATMGTGQVVFGLATVIIGVALFRRLSFVKGTTAVVVGSILYKLCIAVALDLGLPPNMMKLITAVLFLLVLVASGRKGEEIIHA